MAPFDFNNSPKNHGKSSLYSRFRVFRHASCAYGTQTFRLSHPPTNQPGNRGIADLPFVFLAELLYVCGTAHDDYGVVFAEGVTAAGVEDHR